MTPVAVYCLIVGIAIGVAFGRMWGWSRGYREAMRRYTEPTS